MGWVLEFAAGGGEPPRRFGLGEDGKLCFGWCRPHAQVELQVPDPPLDEQRRPPISRRHFAVLAAGTQVAAVDLGSRVGTRVGARALRPGEPARLASGDVIEVGGILRLRVELEREGETRVIRLRPKLGGLEPADLLTKPVLRAAAGFSSKFRTSLLVILITDQVDSTDIVVARGDRFYHRMRAERDALQRGAVERANGGKVLKSTGDGLLCVFREPAPAVRAAVQIQRATEAYNAARPGDPPLGVRIGIDQGQVGILDGSRMDIFGFHVNRSARIMALGGAGEVHVSGGVRDALRGGLESGLAVADLGLVALKGFAEPQPVFRLGY